MADLKDILSKYKSNQINEAEATKRIERYTSSKIGDSADKVIGDGPFAKVEEKFKQLKEFAGSLAEVVGPVEGLAAQQRLFTQATNDFFQAGYTGQFISFSDAISSAGKASLELNGNLDGAQRVMEGFRSRSMALALSNKEFTEQLMQSSVVLERAGFDMDTYADIVDTAAFAFNKNGEEINKLTATLINVQKEIPVSGRELANNFRMAQQQFAYSADKMMDNFIGLQKMSVETGLSFDTLATKFGESLDTFQGSADMAGKLNQVLGKSVFNSIELLNMTEEERANKIRTAIMNSGRSVEQMGKFELKALSSTLGFTPEETRKFLRGDLKLDEMNKLKDVQAKDPAALRSAELATEMAFLKTRISDIRPEIDNMRIAIRNTLAASTEKAFTGSLRKGIGSVEEGLTDQQVTEASFKILMGAAQANKEGIATLSGLLGKESDFVTTAKSFVETGEKIASALAGGLGNLTGVGAEDIFGTLRSIIRETNTELQKFSSNVAGLVGPT